MAFVETATAVGALASGAAAAANAATQTAKNKKSYKYTKKLQDRQNAFNAEQAQVSYNRQRELLSEMQSYDSPVNQMQRFKAAGLNPAMLLSEFGGQTSAPSVGSATSGTSQFQYDNSGMSGLSSGLGNMVSGLNNLVAMNNATRLADADVEKKDAETENIRKDTEKKGSDIQLNDATIAEKNANTELTHKQSDKVVAETKNLTYTLEKMLPVELKARFAEIDKIYNDISNSQQITKGQVALMAKQIDGIQSEIALRGNQMKLNDKNIEFLEQKIGSWKSEVIAEIGLKRSQMNLLGTQQQLQDMSNKVTEDFFNSMYDGFFESSKSKFRKGKSVPNFSNLQMLIWEMQLLNSVKNLGRQ